MNVEKAYDVWAESYDAMQNKTRDLDLVATKENLSQSNFQSILEIGCGTGKNTEWLVTNCKRMTAVDSSEAMMSVAKRKVTDKKIEWKRFDISKPWPIQSESFDLITFNLVLEHVDDIKFVISEAASRLASRGIIHISELHPFKQYLGSKARFESEHGTHELDVFTHHVSDFVQAISDANLQIAELKEWFDDDRQGVPRLLTILAVTKS